MKPARWLAERRQQAAERPEGDQQIPVRRRGQPGWLARGAVRRIHLLGVCGTAMGNFAGLLKGLGFEVTGSDTGAYPPMSDMLADLGIEIMKGWEPAHLEEARPDLVVVGNVCRRDNPEVVAAREQGLPCTSFPAAIAALLLSRRHPVVVSGTHGKTTTSSVLAHCLVHTGRDPGFLVGGVMNDFGSSFRVGADGAPFVIEGDEYDTAWFDKVPKFSHYRPRTAVLTSVEFDHADIYEDLERIEQEFGGLVDLVGDDPAGRLFGCVDGASVRKVAAQAEHVRWYGLGADAALRGVLHRVEDGRMHFSVERSAEGAPLGPFVCRLVGNHNLANLTAVVAVLDHLGLEPAEIASGLASYGGVKRRQEVIAEVDGITVIDDFAHHPTAVRETIAAIRLQYPGRRVWGVFEPRSATSSRAYFQQLYPGALAAADEVLLAQVGRLSIPQEERLDCDALAAQVGALGTRARFVPEVAGIVSLLAAEARPGDVVLLMSNGGFGGIYQSLPAALAERG